MSDEPGRTGRERLVMLSDGVFAIAVTLLALDLRLPEEALRSGHIFAALAANWERGLSFAISFWVIAIFWRANVRSFHWIERVDPPFVALSLLVLMTVSFLPFPTAVLGQSRGVGGEAALFYLASLTVVSLIQMASWIYAVRIGRLMRPHTPPDAVRGGILRGAIPVAGFIATMIAVALGGGTQSFFILLAIPVLSRLMKGLAPSDHG